MRPHSQKADIKIDVFPFTKYGVIDGEVLTITSDAIDHKDHRLVFSMCISVKKSDLCINGKPVTLSPGMSVQVKVKIGK